MVQRTVAPGPVAVLATGLSESRCVLTTICCPGPPRGSSRSGGWQQPRAGSRTDHGPLADGTRPMLEPQVGRAAWLVCAGRDARG